MCAFTSITYLSKLQHLLPLLGRIGLAQRLVVERQFVRILVMAVSFALTEPGRYDCTSATGLTTLWQLACESTVKLPLRSASIQGPVGSIFWVTLTPILLHSSTSQMPTYLYG